MNKLGNVDVDALEAIKAELSQASLMNPMAKRALEMIVNLETLVITNIKHQLQYTKWAVGQISKHQERAAEPSSWEDRMGGQFTQEEIDRSRRGGEGW